MLKTYRGHKYTTCIIDEVTDYLINVHIYQAKSEEVGEGTHRKCYNKILYSGIHNHGSG